MYSNDFPHQSHHDNAQQPVAEHGPEIAERRRDLRPVDPRIRLRQFPVDPQRRGMVSYLGVFKRHRADDYLLSHGLDGWSLALDFKVPRDARRLWDTAADLTRLVLEAGGTYYPAKDQVVDAASFARSLGERLERFRNLKQRLDPGGLFANDQARRLGIV